MLNYAQTKEQELQNRINAPSERVERFPLPKHPAKLFVHADTYPRINAWLDNYRAEFCRVAAFAGGDGHPRRFDYKKLENGKASKLVFI
jgi:hypothetical protein